MKGKWLSILTATFTAMLLATNFSFCQDQQQISDQVYQELDYLYSLFGSEQGIDPERLGGLIELVRTTPEGTNLTLKEQNNMEGAFYSFQIDKSFQDLVSYAYNPDVPPYITMPSSVQSVKWVNADAENEMRRSLDEAEANDSAFFLRGQEHEITTPDTNTGSYYSYNQDRFVTLFSIDSGPVLLSATLQEKVSDVGKRGCIVGEDKNWNYLYSEETGVNTTGLGWVDSYLYEARSFILYIWDSENKTIKAANLKWLNAGWKKINMVKSHHILGGMKRFVADLKSVLESPGLPEVPEIVNKNEELRGKDEEELRDLVAPHIERIGKVKDAGSCPSSFIKSAASGDYLQQMNSEEIVRILLLEYIRTRLGDRTPETATSQSLTVDPIWHKS